MHSARTVWIQSPGTAVRPRGPRRSIEHRDTHDGEHLVEDGGEFGASIANEEAERRCSLAEIDEEIAGLLSGPRPRRK
ncbi:hypothetical protein ACWDA3_60045 [Nonomuraea rubra]